MKDHPNRRNQQRNRITYGYISSISTNDYNEVGEDHRKQTNPIMGCDTKHGKNTTTQETKEGEEKVELGTIQGSTADATRTTTIVASASPTKLGSYLLTRTGLLVTETTEGDSQSQPTASRDQQCALCLFHADDNGNAGDEVRGGCLMEPHAGDGVPARSLEAHLVEIIDNDDEDDDSAEVEEMLRERLRQRVEQRLRFAAEERDTDADAWREDAGIDNINGSVPMGAVGTITTSANSTITDGTAWHSNPSDDRQTMTTSHNHHNNWARKYFAYLVGVVLLLDVVFGILFLLDIVSSGNERSSGSSTPGTTKEPTYAATGDDVVGGTWEPDPMGNGTTTSSPTSLPFWKQFPVR